MCIPVEAHILKNDHEGHAGLMVAAGGDALLAFGKDVLVEGRHVEPLVVAAGTWEGSRQKVGTDHPVEMEEVHQIATEGTLLVLEN